MNKVELFHEGLALFNTGKFFEAHEVWEELWKLEVGSDRIFIQGLIQSAGYFVLIKKNNLSGAERLAIAAKTKLACRPTNELYCALDITPFIDF
jgi:predicted metal-dependent hydrolase